MKLHDYSLRSIKFLLLLLILFGAGGNGYGATFVVTNTNNDGAGSFRQAIINAESAASDDVIEFEPSVFNVPRVINLTGGAIRITGGGGLVINGTGADSLFISGNSRSNILYVSDPVNLTINSVTFFNSVADFDAGAIENGGTLTLNDTVVKDNLMGFDGGGIKNYRSLTVNRCRVSGNTPAGINNKFGSVTINDSTISDNYGVGIITNFNLNVNNSTISGNRSGGLYSGGNGGTPVVTNIINSTISGNFRSGGGGGITLDSGTGTINLINATVAFNSATAFGSGGVARIGGTFNARNSIIARNTLDSAAADLSGTLNSQGYNIIGSVVNGTVNGNTTGNQLNTDPLLLPLGNYGGATPTHALQANSPAIDAGDAANVSAIDQRGVSRPFDGDGIGAAFADIGAVEAGILVTNTNDGGAGSLRQALAVSNAAATVDEIRFSALFDVSQTITLTSGELNIAAGRKVYINGSGAEKLIVSGSNQSRVFSIAAGGSATLNNFTAANGRVASDDNGGGILNEGELAVNDAVIRDNRSGLTGSGGGIFNNGALVLSSSTIRNNTARTGGGITNGSGRLIIRGATVSQNTATIAFGGIVNFDGKMTISRATISGNVSGGFGGGITSQSREVLVVTNSLVSGNVAGSSGGGFYINGACSITDTTISGNTATLDGGGIFNNSPDTVSTNATIAGNSARRGGGVFNNTNVLWARNTIIAKNTATGGSPDFFGTLTSQGYNLIGETSGTTVAGDSTGNLLNVDPLFLSLADNGGATLTYALQTNSPAIDAGDPQNASATDQRGFNRASDGNGDGTPRPDIGAYELGTLITNTNDDGAGSLRRAISDARTGTGDDEIRFSSLFNAPQTIMLTSTELLVVGNGRLIINGAGANLTTISGGNRSRVITVFATADLTLNGVTVTGGRFLFDGGGIMNYGTLKINDSSIVGNTGGSSSNPTGGGGGIYNSSGRLTLTNSTVSNNTLSNGSGGGIMNNNGTVSIVGSNINNNTAASQGGGLSNFGGTITVTDSGVNNNSANRSGGIQNEGTIQLNNSSVSGNSGQQLYGGIYNGSRLTLNNCIVSNNRLINTTNTGDGGGIFNLGTALITNSTVSGNAAGRGGGIANNGGINNDRGRLTTINSTVSGNRAVTQGGGIYSIGGEVNLINATVAYNSANGTGGGVFHVSNANGVLNSRNSIFAANTAGNSNAPSDFTGVLTSQDYNLIGNSSGATITGAVAGNILNTDARLDPVLRNNGGTAPTHALRLDSPAIDAGNASANNSTDQRGQPRPFDVPSVSNAAGSDGSDIGAFERQSSDVTRSTLFDFDGDGKSDVSVFRPGTGVWYLLQSTSGFTGTQFGASTDRIVPADYDGDGRTDVAVFRNGTWYLQRSSQGFTGIAFGTENDIPVPADFSGDGTAELAVYRPSNGNWYVYNLATNQTSGIQFGASDDKPVAADYDGDGKADYAVFRSSTGTWYSQRSRLGFTGIAFGEATDKPTPADYDGDGRTDIAVFRPSNGVWYIQRSTLGFTGVQFGLGTDSPVPADYDGDGKTDVAVYRGGTWYLNRTTAGFTGISFGAASDQPAPNAFVR